jgi:5-hydroxyisourate hydrolase-like protein (transthyretin family)
MNRVFVFLLLAILACLFMLVGVVASAESLPEEKPLPVPSPAAFTKLDTKELSFARPVAGYQVDADSVLITGHVTSEADGSNLAGIQVTVYRVHGTGYTDTWTTTTDAEGHYDIGGLESFAIKISFSDSSNLYLKEYYDNKPDFQSADVYWVSSGGTGTFDAALTESGQITGRVTSRSDGSPIEGVNVLVYENGYLYGNAPYAYTGADGTYRIKGLKTGMYQLEFLADSSYASEFYKNVWNVESATDIPVTEGTTTTIDARLLTAGGISGRVTDEDGQNLKWIIVRAYYWYRESWVTGWNWGTWCNYTDRDGRYELGGMPPGTYRIYFYADPIKWPAGTLAPEYYDNAPDFDSATAVQVRSGKVTGNINAILGPEPPVLTPEPSPTATSTKKPQPTAEPTMTVTPTMTATPTMSITPGPTATSTASMTPGPTATAFKPTSFSWLPVVGR